MAHVIVLESVTEDIFVCGTCKSVFNSLQIFLDHKSFKCSNSALDETYVPTSTISRTASVLNDSLCDDTLALHKIQVLSDAYNDRNTTQQEHQSCKTCKKQYTDTKSLLTHTKTHCEKAYQCLVCGRCFNQNSHLQRHISSHKVWPDGITQTTPKSHEAELLSYSCPYCNVVLSSYSLFRGHLKNHLAFKKFKCIQQDCIVFCDTIESLLEHIHVEHEVLEYACHLCKSVFNSLANIAMHQTTHSESNTNLPKKVQLHKCAQCDAGFHKSDKLALHMLTEDHKKSCIHCGKVFASDKRLRMHLQIHSKFKPFQCNICDVSFPMKKYLSAHMLKHGTRQFKCPVCKYMFKRNDILQRHMRLHQAKKLFKCPFKDSMGCEREFNRNDKLQLHLKSHTKFVSMNTKYNSKQILN